MDLPRLFWVNLFGLMMSTPLVLEYHFLVYDRNSRIMKSVATAGVLLMLIPQIVMDCVFIYHAVYIYPLNFFYIMISILVFFLAALTVSSLTPKRFHVYLLPLHALLIVAGCVEMVSIPITAYAVQHASGIEMFFYVVLASIVIPVGSIMGVTSLMLPKYGGTH